MTVKSLLVKIGADVSDFNKNIDGAKKKFSDLSMGMTRIGAGLTAAVTLPLLGIGAASIKMAMNAVESENLFEISMGGMAGAARAWSEDLRKQLGLNEYELRKNVGVMYSMTTSMGLTKDAAYDVSTGITELTYDCASFYNLDPETMFTKLRSGISGEIEPLKQLGILVDETTVKHYAWANGIAAQGEELTQSQKVMARYGVILAATKNAQGDMARTIDSPTNKLRVMKEQMKMTATELGMQLLPAFNALLGVGSKLVSGIGSVVKVFSSLPAPVKTVILVLAGVAAAAGPALLILAKMLPVLRAMPAVLGMLKSGLLGLLNPYTLIIAAAAAFVVISLQVADAQEKANQASRRFEEANSGLMQKLAAGAQAAGMTAAEFAKLTAKYENNAAAMAMAIEKGKEGKALQEGLAKVGKEHAASIEEQRKALEAAKKAQEAKVAADQQAMASLEAMKQLRAELTNEINKASMSEAEYTKWSLDQQYAARVADIQRSAATAAQKNALLLQAEQAHNLAIQALEKTHMDTMYAAALADRQRWLEAQVQSQATYAALYSEFQAGINQLTMSGLQYELWAIEQERLAKIAALEQETILDAAQKEGLLAKLNEFYAAKKAAAEANAAELTSIEVAALQGLQQLYQGFSDSVIDNFSEIGAGGKSLTEGLKDIFNNLLDNAKSVVKSVVSATISEALRSIMASQAKAIAGAIASVMTALPFPLNVAAVGGAIALVSALFSRIKLGEGGLVTRPTTALIGEKGPELVVPLKRLGFLSPGAGAGGVNVQVSAHFYGNIKTDYSLDEISAKLSDKIQASIQRGRRT